MSWLTFLVKKGIPYEIACLINDFVGPRVKSRWKCYFYCPKLKVITKVNVFHQINVMSMFLNVFERK